MHLQARRIVVAIVTVAATARGAPAQLNDEGVRQAMRRGVEFLYSQQDPRTGGWAEHPSQPCGLSALITLALLNCGEDPQGPKMQRALNYLRAFDKPELTYSVALQTMVLCAAQPQKDRLLIRRNVNWLEHIQIKTGNRKGSWGYSDRQGNGDNSNTQFALLALHEAERAGVTVNETTWRLALGYWLASQNPDGSWGYFPGQSPTGSMTCAGLSSVVIAQGRLNAGAATVRDGRVQCCGPVADDNSVRRGLNWLAAHFSVHTNPGDRMWVLYYLYGFERVGRLTGQRFLGQHDWYREGAEMLVKAQEGFSGFWKGVGHAEDNPLVATSLALLFLSKGRRPVVLSKVKYAENGWDLHPEGVPHLTREIERRWLRDLSWQTVDLAAATDVDLLESPVLFISGRKALRLRPQDKDKLKSFVSQGGFIFAEACNGDGCDGTEFDADFRALLKELFPDSRLRVLPPDHPVWFAEQKVLPSEKRPLLGLDACCRTSVVYCPANLSCLWELDQPLRTANYPADVQAEIQDAVKIGMNVVAYATNRVLKEKLDPPQVARSDRDAPLASRGVLVVPKLAHAGGSDDAPNALANLLDFVQSQQELRINRAPQLISPRDEKLYQYPILFAHGRRDFQFSPEDRQGLAKYLQNGGFLFADAICSSPEFAAAFRREISAALAGQAPQRIPPEHPMLSPDFGGFDVRSVTLNDPQLKQANERLESRRVQVPPQLEGWQIDGRLAVVFSPYDVSCALESRASLECKGYIREDAARLGDNIILYALQQ